MTIQAYFDVSGGQKQGRWMAMSGLLGEAQVFAGVAEAWRKSLEGPYPRGRIAYFKMDEACQLYGEFRGWRADQRDQIVWQLARSIDRGDLLRLDARVDLHAFALVSQRWVQVKGERPDRGLFRGNADPRVLLALCVLPAAIAEAVKRGASTPMDIVFDAQTPWWWAIPNGYDGVRKIEGEIPERRAVLPDSATFGDDRACLPLQAADMLAEELRLRTEDYPDNPPFVGKLCPKLPLSDLVENIGEQRMEEFHQYVWTRWSEKSDSAD